MLASCFSCWQWTSSLIDHEFQTNSVGILVTKGDGFSFCLRYLSSKELEETFHEDFLNTFTLSKAFRLLTLRKAIIWSIDIKNFLLRWLSGIIVPKDINIKRMMLPSNEIATKLQPSQVSRAASEYQASQKSRAKESSASYRFVK